MVESVGIHINKLEANHFAHFPALNSAWHTLLNPETGQVSEIKARNPQTKVLARPYVRDQDYHARYLQGNPMEAGQWAANVVFSQRGRNPNADAWIVLNEPPCDTVEQVERLAQADIAYMKALEAQGLKAGIGAFSTGNLQIPRFDSARQVRAYESTFRYAAENGHYLVLHCYAATRPMMGGTAPSGWVHDPRYFGLRWHEEIFPYMRANGIPIPKTIIAEFGLDLGFAKKFAGYTGQYVGYRVPEPWGYGNSEAGARQYVDDLAPFAAELVKDEEVEGMCIFAAGDNGDEKWRSFMVDGVMGYLASKAFPFPTQPQQPPATPPATPPPVPPYVIDTSRRSPNFDERPAGIAIDTVVLHHTGGSLQSSLNWLTNPASGVSTHYLISKTGKIYRLVDEAKTAWHAGVSEFEGREDVNRFSIGIELENKGDGADPYPAKLLDALVWLLGDLKARRNIKRGKVTTHAEVAIPAGRKNDPRGLDVEAVLNRVYGTPVPVPPPVLPDFSKIVWQGEDAMRAEEREGRKQNAEWIRLNWVEPAIRERDKVSA